MSIKKYYDTAIRYIPAYLHDYFTLFDKLKELLYISNQMNLPNSLTFSRILAVPLLVILLLSNIENKELITFIIFTLAALTDTLDGYIARKKNQISIFGQLLDPIADKLLIVSVFICFIELDIVSAWMVVIIIGREISVTGFRALASSKGIHISASLLGKIKMNAETFTIALLLLGEKYLGNLFVLSQIGLYLVIITAVISSAEYFIKYGSKVLTK